MNLGHIHLFQNLAPCNKPSNLLTVKCSRNTSIKTEIRMLEMFSSPYKCLSKLQDFDSSIPKLLLLLNFYVFSIKKTQQTTLFPDYAANSSFPTDSNKSEKLKWASHPISQRANVSQYHLGYTSWTGKQLLPGCTGSVYPDRITVSSIVPNTP